MYLVAIYCNMLHHAHEVEQNQCIINILVGVLHLDLVDTSEEGQLGVSPYKKYN